MAVISVSLPDELLEKIDDIKKTQGYSGRSEVIRDAVRNLISEYEFSRLEKGLVSSTITVLYEYKRTDVEERISKLRHEFNEIVTNNLHMHIGEKYCLELFISEGKLEDITKFIGRMRAIKDIITIRHSTVSLEM
ncbi:MAG: nickel-responsive transcriptional regulator NikR [Candidatus Hydrothermarchaeota archaeon]